ncbi:MAG: hypothetical protein EZS28_021467 [Streblomastix strix]|uniref:Uncharacterized protein n=1 Tax=Streblomastix strix TaxID=222440 RepID=A0A5J4VKK6_9EUKA|nr:MAG: hypothetical protein EZS28_021467 [Streblomastix strix]
MALPFIRNTNYRLRKPDMLYVEVQDPEKLGFVIQLVLSEFLLLFHHSVPLITSLNKFAFLFNSRGRDNERQLVKVSLDCYSLQRLFVDVMLWLSFSKEESQVVAPPVNTSRHA